MLFWMMVLSGLYIFLSYGYHYLVMIISLELVMLSLLMKFVMVNTPVSGIYYFIYFLVLLVCMGCYGVTMIMWSYRSSGSDLFFH